MQRAKVFPLVILLAAGLRFSCARRVAVDDIERQPRVTEADRQFAGIFKPLDGVWEGIHPANPIFHLRLRVLTFSPNDSQFERNQQGEAPCPTVP